MSASATHPTPHDPGPQAADTHATDTEFYRQALHDLITVGTSLARHLPTQADAQAAHQSSAPAPQPAPAQPAPHPTNAQPAPAPDALVKIVASFDPLARAVRRCIAQAQNLNAPKQQPARNPAQPPAPDRTAARKRILRAVEDNIQRPPDNPECDDAEILLSDFRERMDAPDLDDDISRRPVADIIQDILRDLGLAALPGSRPWKRRTPADIAELNARAAAPTSPASSATCQPGPGPQDGSPAAAQPAPDPADQHASGHPKPVRPSAAARPPVRPGHTLPEDPAEAVAFVLHQVTQARSRPPPGD